MVNLCEGFIQPLDLECLFVNFLAGEWIIFGLLAIVFIISVAATFRMSNIVTGASILIFSTMFYDQMPWLAYISILIGSILIWGAATFIWKR